MQKVRRWFGALYPAVNAQAAGHTPPEDYPFGFYNGDAVEADNTARMQPYHLIVVSAGNDREQAASGSVLSWMEVQSPTQGGTNARIGGSGSVWFSTELVDGTPVYYCSHLKAYVLETNVTLKLAGTDIDNDCKFNDQDPDIDGDNLLNGPDGPDTDNDLDGLLNEGEPDDPTDPKETADPTPNGPRPYGIIDDASSVVTITLDNIPDDGTLDTLPGGHTVSKNALCVGALAGAAAQVPASYSSFGPTDDGRLKPDIVAQGGDSSFDGNGVDTGAKHLQMIGSGSTTDHGYHDYGTSFASPVVAAGVTLLSELQEHLRGIEDPFRSSTFKALLCHTARDISIPGPDFMTGYGEVDVEKAAVMIRDNYPLRPQITEVFLPYSYSYASITMRADETPTPVKVTIAWTDLPGLSQPAVVDPPGDSTTPNHRVLRNDMNLTVRKLATNQTYYPWAPDPGNPYSPSPQGVNHRDNVEQVLIQVSEGIAANDEYEIKINRDSSSTPWVGGGQWVSIAFSGLNLLPGPAEGTILSSVFAHGGPTGSWNLYVLSFKSAMGGYYVVQYKPGNTWVAAPGIGVIYAVAGSTTVNFYDTVSGFQSSPFPVRVLSIQPDPFAH